MNVLVTGGAGYVGSVLVPKLLNEGHQVKVLDLFIYGKEVFDDVRSNPRLTEIQGDLRDVPLVKTALKGVEAVIHLACISNDPSYELNPTLGKTINFDAFRPLVQEAKAAGVKRFIYASSSSVYGVNSSPSVTEDLPLEPLTDYSKYKALCEEVLLEEASDEMTCLILRPATVCGYSPRLRLDLTVNILTNHAINKGKISVFGGDQKRPNLHIEDMTDLYVESLKWPAQKIHKQIFNAGYQNHSVLEIAQMVRNEVSPNVEIECVPTDDNRSYHICSEKIERALGFKPKHTISEAIRDLHKAFGEGKVPNPINGSRYYNIKQMQLVDLR